MEWSKGMPGKGLIVVKTRIIHQLDCSSKLTHTQTVAIPQSKITYQIVIDRLTSAYNYNYLSNKT